jgi:hypothetical protein
MVGGHGEALARVSNHYARGSRVTSGTVALPRCVESFQIVERGVLPDGRPFRRCHIQVQERNQRFTLYQPVITELGLRTDSPVELRIQTSLRLWTCVTALGSRNEVYRVTDGARDLVRGECIEVLVAAAP